MSRFTLPMNEFQHIRDTDLQLDPTPHPFETAHISAIDQNWRKELEEQPALYNGKLLLFSELREEGGTLHGRAHLADFKTLLYWRRIRPHPEIGHCFAHAALVSSDDALIAIRMAAHTASPGKVYFAAGSLEPDDLDGTRIDVDANMRREVGEETGLDLAKFVHEPDYHVLATDAGTVIFRRYRLDMTANDVVEAITRHIEADREPEIEAPVVLRQGDRNPAGLLPHMQAFCDWHFANPVC